MDEDLQETFPFLDDMAETEVAASDRNPNKAECSPNSYIGRAYRVKREVLSQIDWDNPQFSYSFKLFYSLRTKIERLFSPIFGSDVSGTRTPFFNFTKVELVKVLQLDVDEQSKARIFAGNIESLIPTKFLKS